jgi:two-component system alkaline phosphatase synthesis response regulator PhoP
VARFLKFDEQYKHIPILMLTARTQQKDKEMGSAAGADAYLTKPFDAKELLATVARLLQRNPEEKKT